MFENHRVLLFLVGCIGSRILFAYIAKVSPAQYLPWLGFLALIPAVGFFYLFFTGQRVTGKEVFGERIWWTWLRPIHGTLWLLFAYSAFRLDTNAWKYLAIDVVFGLAAYITFHFGGSTLKGFISSV